MTKKTTRKLVPLSLATMLMIPMMVPTNVQAASTYKLTQSAPVYYTSADAKAGRNQRGTYKAGTYYIYNSVSGAINISKYAGSPGGWIRSVASQNKTPTPVKVTVQPATSIPNVGQTIKISNSISGHNNAADAMAGRNRTTTYKAGTYYIYKKYTNGAINITRVKGTPGAWVNPKNIQSTTSVVAPKPTVTPSPKPVVTNPIVVSSGQVTLKTSVAGYNNAVDAMVGKNRTATYNAGTYYIYRTYTNGAINITRTKGVPGVWINPKATSTTNVTTPVQTKPSNPTPVNNTSRPMPAYTSTKLDSWSWGYPSTYGKQVLANNNGAYRIGNKVYITFDNGYEYKNLTASILDTLKAKNVKSVFFVTGAYIRENPQLVRRMVREGHIVGNHTNKHLSPHNVSAERIIQDIKEWETVYKNVIGTLPKVKLYRPAAGVFSERIVAGAYSMGYKTLLWDFGYADWDTNSQPSTTYALNHIKNNTKKGSIVLLHSVSSTNTKILGQYIDWLRANGYGIGSF